MSSQSQFNRSCGYWPTPRGRLAVREVERCKCVPKLEGGMFVCPACETVYALVRQLPMPHAFNDKPR